MKPLKTGRKELKTYYSVSDEDEGTIIFEDYGMAYDHLNEMREEGRATKYQRVKRVKMTEEKFNSFTEL